ncbi:Ionotropic glutamate receptor [Corchorus capsularis]|uniref:Glutamate receptor n=1 Tax=Corchorus capsularis TaxID=210143 RepID=A0A1R3I192_COCAP|nr:Ionotropic glutamate receptor [Corchorus capsularis]
MNKTFICDVKAPQPGHFHFANRVLKLWLFIFVFLISFLVFGHGEETGKGNRVTNIGAIIDVDSRIGKEEKTALEIAVQSFNNSNSTNLKLSLHIHDSGRDPLQAATSAWKLIKDKKVKAIAGMETWEEAVLVADVGSRAQVPVLSFAAPAITPPLTASRWPFLVRMANGDFEQLKCIANIISSFNWKRVIVIYEDDSFGGDSGKFALLSEALRNVSSEIDYRLVLPPFSSLSNPNKVVQEELMRLLNFQSQVFIVLQSSMSMTKHLFEKAKEIGLVGRDSVWIITDTISSYLDSFNSSVISSMEGTLGIKTYYSEESNQFKKFYPQFRKTFRNEYSEEDNFQPGLNSLRAYDSIEIIRQSIERLKRTEQNSSKALLSNILSSNFTGLSGEIRFDEEGKLFHDPILRIVNVVGKKYKELDFWIPGVGFSKNNFKENKTGYVSDISVELGGRVSWPGDQKQVPKGWAMPTNIKPLIIGVPARTAFEKFVKVENGKNPGEKIYKGFCIELFYQVLGVLGYDLPYIFDPHNGTYDELVHKVYNKTYDAAVGDITILASRTNDVEFTQPYAESGLSMIVPAKSRSSAWMFLKPFTKEMWLVTAAILIYTMLIVWFLEHQSNPEFEGPWNNQIGTALWFTFSSLFFAHNGTLKSLEEKWFAPDSPQCSANLTDDSKTDSLSLHSFWGLYLISGATSTICLLIFLTHLLQKYCKFQREYYVAGNLCPANETVWVKAIRVAKYLYHGEICIQVEASPAPQATPDRINEWSSSRWDSEIPNMGSLEVTTSQEQRQTEVDMR